MTLKNEVYVDLCVIGAGAAGLSVAAGAVQLGLDTALIEKDKMGGECLNTGCVPSKALLASAKKAQNFRTAEKFGIKSTEPEINFLKVKKHVFDIIKRIEPHDSAERYEALGVKVFHGEASFLDAHKVQVDQNTIIADKFVIATGTKPHIPDIHGLKDVEFFTHETIFNLRVKPKHLIIIGSGPVGIELAQAHQRLGIEVTVLSRGNVLSKEDEDITNILKSRLIAEGVEIRENIEITNIQNKDSNICLDVTDHGDNYQVIGSHLLVATGKKKNFDALCLEKANIKYSDLGITTNKNLKTNQKHIYAIGDIIDGPLFTHAASYQATIALSNIAFRFPLKVNYKAFPRVTYTDPEIAHVGMTEEYANETVKGQVIIHKWKFKNNDRAVAERQTEGFIKVIAKPNGKILGVSIIGPAAGEMISLWCLAIKENIKLSAIANMVAAYPTYNEISKRVAGMHYTSSLFNDKTRAFVNFLRKLPS